MQSHPGHSQRPTIKERRASCRLHLLKGGKMPPLLESHVPCAPAFRGTLPHSSLTPFYFSLLTQLSPQSHINPTQSHSVVLNRTQSHRKRFSRAPIRCAATQTITNDTNYRQPSKPFPSIADFPPALAPQGKSNQIKPNQGKKQTQSQHSPHPNFTLAPSTRCAANHANQVSDAVYPGT
jgi:hypothetical protein